MGSRAGVDERLCPLHVHTNPRDRRTLLRNTDTVTPAQAQSGRSHGPQRLNAAQEAANRAEGDRKAGATSDTHSWGASQVGCGRPCSVLSGHILAGTGVGLLSLRPPRQCWMRLV